MHADSNGRRPHGDLRRSWTAFGLAPRAFTLVGIGIGLHALGAVLEAHEGSPAWRGLGAMGWWAFGLASADATGRMGEVVDPDATGRMGEVVDPDATGRMGEVVDPDVTGRAHDPAGPRLPRSTGWILALAVVAIGEALRHASAATAGHGDVAAVAEAVGSWPAAAAAVLFAGLPALGEESFFRGAGLRWLARRAGPGWAWATSAGAFACVHPGQILPAAVFGGALAALALATGRTREAMAAHAVHNLVALRMLGL